MLVRRVEGVERHRGEAGERGGRDDRSPAPLAQRRQRRDGAEDDAVEVDAHHLPIAIEVEVVAEADPAGDAGVEIDEVETAVLAADDLDELAVGLQRRDVARDEQAADLLRDILTGLVHVGDHHLGAGAGERSRRGRAEAAGAAGDEGDLAGQLRGPGRRRARAHRATLCDPRSVAAVADRVRSGEARERRERPMLLIAVGAVVLAIALFVLITYNRLVRMRFGLRELVGADRGRAEAPPRPRPEPRRRRLRLCGHERATFERTAEARGAAVAAVGDRSGGTGPARGNSRGRASAT